MPEDQPKASPRELLGCSASPGIHILAEQVHMAQLQTWNTRNGISALGSCHSAPLCICLYICICVAACKIIMPENNTVVPRKAQQLLEEEAQQNFYR